MKAFFKFTSVGFIQPILGFLLLPIYLNYIPVSEYGILTLLTAFFAVFGSFSFLKSDMAMRTLFFNYDKKTEQRHLFQTLFGFQISLSVLWLLIFLVIGNYLFEFIFSSEVHYFPFGLLFSLTVFIGGANNLYLIYIQNQKKANLYSKLVIFSSCSQVGLQAILILVFDLGIQGYLYGSLLPQILVLSYILLRENKVKLFRFKDPTLIKSLIFSISFIPFLILLTLEQNINKFMLEHFASLEVVAVFGVLFSISNIVVITNNIVDNSIRPYLYKYLSIPTIENLTETQKLTRLYFDILCLAIIAVFGVGNFLPTVIEPQQYQELPKFMSLLCLSLIPYISVRYFALVLIYQKRTQLLNKVYFFKLLAMTVLFLIFIPKYGINGILYTTLISNTINAIIFYKSVSESLKAILLKSDFYILILILALLTFSLVFKDSFYLQLFSVIFILIVIGCLLKSHFRYFRAQTPPR